MSVDTSTTPQEQATDKETSAPATAATEPAEGAPAASVEDTPKAKRGRPKGAPARRTRTVELTLTVTGSADGEWQAELKHGTTWVARGLAISAAAVSRAAKELHEDLSKPIDEVINTAREQQKAKVAQLEAELEQAKQALAELDG
ncbi:MAG TPA: DUF6319 family protein [Amycolatopsis sp.]|nr:DUF6319 family protein [Amycolatopsis sp.]